jgi:hypothetical protein
MASDITGRIYWFKNIGTRTQPKLAPAQSVRVDLGGKPPSKPAWNWWNPVNDELVVEWRCTPALVDLDGKGSLDLVSVDHEGYLALFKKVFVNGEPRVRPGERIFRMRGVSTFGSGGQPTSAEKDGALHATDGLLRMNTRAAGGSGRRTYVFVDWDGDGKTDLLVNSANVNFYKNVSAKPGEWLFEDKGPLDTLRLAGHSTTPAAADMDGDGKPDLLVGAEDGYFYYLPHTAARAAK